MAQLCISSYLHFNLLEFLYIIHIIFILLYFFLGLNSTPPPSLFLRVRVCLPLPLSPPLWKKYPKVWDLKKIIDSRRKKKPGGGGIIQVVSQVTVSLFPWLVGVSVSCAVAGTLRHQQARLSLIGCQLFPLNAVTLWALRPSQPLLLLQLGLGTGHCGVIQVDCYKCKLTSMDL